MFVHIFAFRWQEGATQAHQSAAVRDIMAFQGKVAGLKSVVVGDNCSPNSPDLGTTGVMVFDTRAAFDAYTTHPGHLRLLAWLIPLVEAVELDFVPIVPAQ